MKSPAPLSLAMLLATLTGCSDVSSPAEAALSRTAAAGNDTPVTSVVADADPAIAPALQIRSDGSGPYRNSNALTSVIQGIGAWVLDSRASRQGTRRLYLDFSRPIAGSGPGGGAPLAVPSGLYRVRAIAKCNLYGVSLLTVAPGASVVCPLHIGFDVAGTTYAIQMNPYPSSGDPDGAPETNYANVRCTVPSSGAGPCSAWWITPSAIGTTPEGAAEYRNAARLIKYVTAKGVTTGLNQGDFYFSFSIQLTNP